MFTRVQLIFALTFSVHFGNVALAVQARSKKPAQASTQTQPPCLLCDWTVAPEIAVAAQGDACEDLLPAACLGPQGEYKTKALFDKIEKKLKELVKTAQGKAAQQMGYSSFDDAMIKILSREGFALKKDISEKAKKFILENDYKNYVQKNEIFEVAAECAKDREKISAIKYYEINEVPKLLEVLQQMDDFQKKYQAVSAQYFLKDVPGLLNKIGTVCKSLESSKEELKTKGLLEHPLIKKVQNICARKKELREKAVGFYLKQDDPKTKDEITQFVQENSDIFNASFTSLKTEEATKPITDVNSARQKIIDKSMEMYSVCNNMEERLDGGPRQVTQEVLELTGTAKATVEYLIDQIYTAERKAKVEAIHLASKTEAFNVARRLTQDQQKLSRIYDHYKRMNFTWFAKPTADRYKKDKKSGIDVLELKRFDPTDVWNQAFSGDLSFFTMVNAFYLPDTKFGSGEKSLSVTMLPIFMEILDENPHAFLSVMAHEVGHNIGPLITEVNNYNLKKEYEPLLQCLASSDSIRMQDDQADESVADVVSAEVMAKLVSQLPQEKRRAAVFASMQTFCKFLDMGDEEMSLSLKESHPESILRISGIFGANRSLRKAISCEGEAKKFRTCSLEGAQ